MSGVPTRVGARTNLALLGLLVVAFATGWLAFAYATAPARWSLAVHATSGVAIVLLLPWKSMVARRGLGRPRPGRWGSIALSVLVLISLGAGLAHSIGFVFFGPFTAMEFHVGAALVAVPFVVWHLAARRIRLRSTDLSRRTFLRGAGVLSAAALTYGASELAVRAAALPGRRRRFTGSYESGSFQPELMPVSSWMFDPIPHLDAGQWALRVGDRRIGYDELSAFNETLVATLDCTGGFYSTQEWSGVRLDRLVNTHGATSIRVVSHTGYDRRFPVEEASRLLLATRFGGQALDAGHGFPARLVAPDRRGFWWVKWVVAIEVDDLPYWWQSPFPTQ
ncbi:MAG TPA: molybdopterin-dependent oxidoreductase [Candidatus Limnocylindrales bacterium]|nr:molybdopterin-dependent oxidoreductase [Candidatus Limnocylindrales bacterium]